MTTPVPVFIPYEHREHLATHWLNRVEEWDDTLNIAGVYCEELSELAASWRDLTDSERGLLVLACDLIKGGELP
jgi:hypothetical protein